MSGCLLAALWGLGHAAQALFGWTLVSGAEVKVKAWQAGLGGWGYVVGVLAVAAPGVALYAAARLWKADTGVSDTVDNLRRMRVRFHPKVQPTGLEVLAGLAPRIFDPTEAADWWRADAHADAVLTLIFEEKLKPYQAEGGRENREQLECDWENFISLLRLHSVIDVQDGKMRITEPGKLVARRARKAHPRPKWIPAEPD